MIICWHDISHHHVWLRKRIRSRVRSPEDWLAGRSLHSVGPPKLRNQQQKCQIFRGQNVVMKFVAVLNVRLSGWALYVFLRISYALLPISTQSESDMLITDFSVSERYIKHSMQTPIFRH